MSEDTSWVFDSLVCFLHGPVWNAPLQTFVEEKSIIFDPNKKPDDANPDYNAIHDEYKNLVDYMLGSFMEEMQISPEQFEVACLEGRQSGPGNAFSFHQGLFQQIWAANDIRIFIRMMIQRNVELQLQALDLIERRQNSMPKDDVDETAGVSEKEVVENAETSAEEIAAADETTEKELFEAVEHELTDETKPLRTDDETTDKFQRLNLFFEKEKISSEEVQSRQDYLRAQRDKILDIKKKARAHQLNESVRKNGRPPSAQAAQNILESGNGGGSRGGGDIAHGTETHEASLQLRKTLAKRLRTEVVGER